ncbi:Hypothetical protein HVR_LOCUS878 [uncultured virus]|nr:Hypothetical protein HVR_LOCUS878 [uncultured virus]
MSKTITITDNIATMSTDVLLDLINQIKETRIIPESKPVAVKPEFIYPDNDSGELIVRTNRNNHFYWDSEYLYDSHRAIEPLLHNPGNGFPPKVILLHDKLLLAVIQNNKLLFRIYEETDNREGPYKSHCSIQLASPDNGEIIRLLANENIIVLETYDKTWWVINHHHGNVLHPIQGLNKLSQNCSYALAPVSLNDTANVLIEEKKVDKKLFSIKLFVIADVGYFELSTLGSACHTTDEYPERIPVAMGVILRNRYDDLHYLSVKGRVFITSDVEKVECNSRAVSWFSGKYVEGEKGYKDLTI